MTFYEDLCPYYHLIYPDWKASIARQASALDTIIRQRWPQARELLDVSCGIGTQALGLAERGYQITASDLSSQEVERARREAGQRGLNIAFSTADMMQAWEHHARQFDVVLSADNSVPHLLCDEDILRAFRQFQACTQPGGGCLITVRDYEQLDLSREQHLDYGEREAEGAHWKLWQKWIPDPPHYTVEMHIEEQRPGSASRHHATRSRYYAISCARLLELMEAAGFTQVARLDEVFYQPVLVGNRE